MKILVLGTTGMLGHLCYDYFKEKHYEVIGYSRLPSPRADITGNVFEINWNEVITDYRVDVVINCIGMLNNSSRSIKDFLSINATLPHMLMYLSSSLNFHFIHVSTDCVFNGLNGPYKSSDTKDAMDNYGFSKALGEEIITGKNTTVIRTSIIGPELSRANNTGLLHWFISQRGKLVQGYTDVYWSGLTTLELSRVVERIINTSFFGFTQVSTEKCISKYDLLKIINEQYKLKIEIRKTDHYKSNKCLISSGDFTVETIENQVRDLYEYKSQI